MHVEQIGMSHEKHNYITRIELWEDRRYCANGPWTYMIITKFHLQYLAK